MQTKRKRKKLGIAVIIIVVSQIILGYVSGILFEFNVISETIFIFLCLLMG